MPIKTTHLLPDDPATSDEFGTHKKIADLLREEILHSTEGRSIALVGDWGSGKSTVIELLRREIGQGQNATSHLFVYDAWSHQGDSLRRAFLDDFIASLDWRLTTEQLTDATDKIWNQTETTTTTTEPVLRRHAKALLLTLAFIPLGMKLFDLPSKTELWTGLLQARNIFAYALILAPVICVTVFALIRRTTFNGLKRFLFGDSYSESHFSVLSFFVERTQGRIEHKHTKTPLDLSDHSVTCSARYWMTSKSAIAICASSLSLTISTEYLRSRRATFGLRCKRSSVTVEVSDVRRPRSTG